MKKDDGLTRRIMEKVHELRPFFDDAKYERMTPKEQNEYLLYCSNIEYERQGRIARETKEEMIREREEMLKLKGKLETAKAMKAEGIPAEIIAKCTGLSIEGAGLTRFI